MTKQRRRLDEAFVRVSVGLNTVDTIVKCRINGAEFKIKIEEINCMDEEANLKQMGDEDTSSDSEGSEIGDCIDEASSVEAMDFHSPSVASGDETAVGGNGVQHDQGGGYCMTNRAVSGTQKAADKDKSNMGGSNQVPPGSEAGEIEASHGIFEDGEGTGIGPKTIVGSVEVGPLGLVEGGPRSMTGPVTQLNPLLTEGEPNSDTNSRVHFSVGLVQGQDPNRDNQSGDVGIRSRHGSRNEKGTGGETLSETARAEGRVKQKGRIGGRGLKSKRNPFTPKEWEDFIGSMASAEELESMGINKKKGKRARGAGDKRGQIQSSESSGKKCWEFGKQLGLSAFEGDEIVERYLEGVGEDLGGLGAGKESIQ